MPQSLPCFAAAPLLRWTTQVLERCGVAGNAAQTTAQALVRTSLRGIDTHGIARLPAYVERLESGDFNASAISRLSLQHGLLRCHGDDGLGQAVVHQALSACLERARETALVACSIEACGHLGALGVLLLPALETGHIALLCQRTQAIMALPGASAPAIGNNPIAFGAPLAGRPPVVFDSALSVVARGHLVAAVRDGRHDIPADWALDRHGQPTTHAQAALDGLLQPIAGYKGLGLAILVECLAGALRSEPPDPAAGAASGSAGHLSAFLLVINPRLATENAKFSAHMDAWLQTLTASSPEARYPGERQHQCEVQRARDGIPIPDQLLRQLNDLAQAKGVAFPLPGARP